MKTVANRRKIVYNNIIEDCVIMKKTLVIIIVIFVAIMSILMGMMWNNNMQARELRRYNMQFEQYKDRQLMGTEIGTVINKVVDMNRRNDVDRGSRGEFIANYENSINIEIEMLVFEDIVDDEEVYRHETFTMEQIYRMGVVNFVQAFNFVTFELTRIEYHDQTGKVRLMVFEQLEA